MPAEYFLDTNILVYSLDVDDPKKRSIARALLRDAALSGRGCISYQVVGECLNVMLRKASARLDVSDARDFLGNVLKPLNTVLPTPKLYEDALALCSRYQLAFYDAAIVAAALSAGCTTLYSEDLQHGQRFRHVVVNNPFL